jgi:predicted GH43/DUF377 family glycosyl hydrolase
MNEKKISWKKLGLVVEAQSDLWWMQSYGMVPTLDKQSDGSYKIYFSGRDKNNVSHIGWVRVEPDDPTNLIEYSKEPVLSPGERGCFDDNGVTPASIVRHENKIFLYYIGWNPGHNVRMHLFGGLAISNDEGETFERYSRAPIIERCKVNPFLNTAPYVLREGEDWLMYYVSGTEWIHKDLPRYNIQMANSKDGKNWNRQGKVAIDYKDNTEFALARPWVLKDSDGIYKMWFSYKGDVATGSTYRMGFATSNDGKSWNRQDQLANIGVSESGWDSKMIEYAAVMDHNGKKIMFYNGNNYGYDGIGVAVEV